jgi:hypothetical protein
MHSLLELLLVVTTLDVLPIVEEAFQNVRIWAQKFLGKA